MLREGKYAAYYEKACREAEKAKATGLRPLEFTHVMIDEAGQVSTLLTYGNVWLLIKLAPKTVVVSFLLTYACELLVFHSHPAVASPSNVCLLPSCSIITAE